MTIDLLQDFFFGALASIGFATISNTPIKALPYCGIIAGVGHCLRYLATHHGCGIIFGSFIGALVIGTLAVMLSHRVRCPAESLSSPALLPMIPGMYAYRSVHAIIGCLSANSESMFNHNLYLLNYNAMITFFVIFVMVLGITLPIFIFKKTSFEATKRKHQLWN